MKASLQDAGLNWVCMVLRPLCNWRVPFSGSDRPISMCSALTPYRYPRIVPCWRSLASSRKVAKHKSVS